MQTVEQFITKLLEVLEENYKQYTISYHRNAILRGDNIQYHRQQLDKIYVNDFDRMIFEAKKGKKYTKIVARNQFSGGSHVHCFIDSSTGEVYKSASWKSPAKGVRFHLMDEVSREECYRRADWAGSYLYSLQ